jgi:SpoVK/Ycf46/Vps4 family AAA+-type ATPase
MSRGRIKKATDTAESRYAKGKTAEWMLNLLESGIFIDEPFWECAEWILGNLRKVLSNLEVSLKTRSIEGAISNIYEELSELIENRRNSHIYDEVNELVETNECLYKPLLEAVRSELAAAAKNSKENVAVYRKARQGLKRTFGLREDACAICEFIFIKDEFSPIERYFEDSLGIFRFSSRKRFADMFCMKSVELQTSISELVSSGICEVDSHSNYCHLADGIGSFWENVSSVPSENIFCRPLRGKTLPLESFDILPDDVAHVLALLKHEGDFPVHILLYGEPGTGKTTFARSLASELNIKAWCVPCGDEDEARETNNRRARLTACLNMASKHKNAFVLMDEADRFLDTGSHYGWKGKDKAWINGFLEQPGRKVIWIANDIDHVHPSVRRRFSYSVRFKPLNREELRRIWKSVLKERHVIRSLSEEQIKRFASDYRVSPSVVESAVCQAKTLSRDKKDFATVAERVLRAHVTLSNDGTRTCPKPQSPGEYSLDGICLEGSVVEFLEKCRRVDAVMREDKPIRSGAATMLFYGPPGSGKSALAKYLADKLERELVVRRASDLLGPYVGMSERLVAEAFRDAERAVLVIDEADSFLYPRASTSKSWENTLVNEFLTSLEECCGFCVCTTNRMEDMDAAALRRFSFKMSFGYAGTEQTRALYKSLLSPLVDGTLPKYAEEELARMQRLTPGDFHTIKSQYWLAERGEVTHKQLLESLAAEEKIKRDGQARRVGF